MNRNPIYFLPLAIATLCWLATGSALSTRTIFLFNYASIANLPPLFEVIGGSLSVVSVLFALLLSLAGFIYLSKKSNSLDFQSLLISSAWFFLASFPLAILIIRAADAKNSGLLPQTYWWEPILFAVLSGYAFSSLRRLNHSHSIQQQTDETKRPNQLNSWLPWCILMTSSTACAAWWCWQSHDLFNNFQLGFNDFGHFLLRVINTARFDGFLKETVVLPPFWDHFNPGLSLLVPLCWITEDARLTFYLQAASLAFCALIIYTIARRHGNPSWASMLWGLAWLSYPSIGQMNLAYTYGWHPISLAIPSLLGAYACWISNRTFTAIGLAVLASSFEEGVIAAIGSFAASEVLRIQWGNRSHIKNIFLNKSVSSSEIQNRNGWLIVWIVATISFLLIYRFSGLAEFQTGRFAKLGNGPGAILLSPVLRTDVWFELLLRERNAAFLAFLFAPFVFYFRRSSFRWAVLAVTPLLVVLLIWEHLPAQSIAFQYASVVLPILFIGAIRSENPNTLQADSRSLPTFALPTFALITGFVLSCFVGQFPWTPDTLSEVKNRSYGPNSMELRGEGSPANRAFHEQIQQLRTNGILSTVSNATSGQGEPLVFSKIRILATGRLASHLLGGADLETVGQYIQRADDYHGIAPNLQSPLLRYDILALDPLEAFQQLPEETQKVQAEAVRLGFSIVRSPDGFEMWFAPNRSPSSASSQNLNTDAN